jgi:hypothetical protein
MALVVIVCLLLAGERLWRRAKHYRRQAALCAYFELQTRWYAEELGEVDESIGDTEDENDRPNLVESRRYGALKVTYGRVARQPWLPLPTGMPTSVNAWDLKRLSAFEVEVMVQAWRESPPPHEKAIAPSTRGFDNY